MNYDEIKTILADRRRPSKDEYFMLHAVVDALMSTCARRKVGAVLVDRNYHILSTGYNGNARGLPHCIEFPCPGANLPSGTGLDLCEAVHAEQNAISQCRDEMQIHSLYTTSSPCISCTKLLMNTGCERIIYLEEYPVNGRKLWESMGRKWEHLRV